MLLFCAMRVSQKRKKLGPFIAADLAPLLILIRTGGTTAAIIRRQQFIQSMSYFWGRTKLWWRSKSFH